MEKYFSLHLIILIELLCADRTKSALYCFVYLAHDKADGLDYIP